MKKTTLRTPLLLLVTCGLIFGCAHFAKRMQYPEARMDATNENYHGTWVADPYRWLEDPDAPETQRWVEGQNLLTAAYLDTPARSEIEARLKELWDYPKYSVPSRIEDRLFFRKNDGLQNQSVLYKQNGTAGAPEVLIDPNLLSEDGTVALRNLSFSHDGSLLAYGLSYSGSDQQEIHVRDVQTGRDFEDHLQWCKFTGIAWKHDNSGFFYNRFPEPGTVPEEDSSHYNKLYWHKLGTPQADDPVVYERPDDKKLAFYPIITHDGRYLVLHVSESTDPQNRIYYREVESGEPFVRLLDDGDAMYDLIHNEGAKFYFRTDLNAPRSRVIEIDLRRPQPENWKEIVPERDEVLSSARVIAGRLVLAYMRDAHSVLEVYSLDGEREREIPLPALGSLLGISGRPEHTDMYFGFTSYLYPSAVFHYDFETQETTQVYDTGIAFDAGDYETKQIFYTSKDGTKVPMFITHKKGLELDGGNPTILYGYGGFAIDLTPSFSVVRLLWMERGGVFAVVNLRGGGEYGEEWHLAGKLEKKQNRFDDFIPAAEWLIDSGYTSTPKLAIQGGSNGGLLTAACLLQRPDLFGAVLCHVPVTDMLRFHKFTAGRFWTAEYGNAEENPEHFKFMYAYSPLHNVKSGVAYPPTLVTTADTDDRVVSLHAKKFTAALQAAHQGSNPILLRVETKAGHGAGKPTEKVIQERADHYAFLYKVMGLD